MTYAIFCSFDQARYAGNRFAEWQLPVVAMVAKDHVGYPPLRNEMHQVLNVNNEENMQ